MTGIERRRASSTSDWVVGPKLKRPDHAPKLGQPPFEIEGAGKLVDAVESLDAAQFIGQERDDQLERDPACHAADAIIGISEHDVVDAWLSLDRPRLAARQANAGHVLQFDRDMLGDMADPCALAQPLDETAAPLQAAAVALQPRQQLDQPVGKARDAIARIVFQPAQIEHDADKGRVAEIMRPAIDADFQDAHRLGHRTQGGIGLQLAHQVLLGCPAWEETPPGTGAGIRWCAGECAELKRVPV
jgi:hypothetical protein